MNINPIQPAFKGTIVVSNKGLTEIQQQVIDTEMTGVIIPQENVTRIWNHKGPDQTTRQANDILNLIKLTAVGVRGLSYDSTANDLDSAKAVKHPQA